MLHFATLTWAPNARAQDVAHQRGQRAQAPNICQVQGSTMTREEVLPGLTRRGLGDVDDLGTFDRRWAAVGVEATSQAHRGTGDPAHERAVDKVKQHARVVNAIQTQQRGMQGASCLALLKPATVQGNKHAMLACSACAWGRLRITMVLPPRCKAVDL